MTARRLKRLAADRSGLAAVEFAILAPIAIGLATVGFAGVMLHAGAVSLEMGAAAAARASIIGAIPAGTTRPAEIRRIVTAHVCPPGGGFCYWDSGWLAESDDGVVAPLRIEMRAYVDPRNIGRPEPFVDKKPYNGVYDLGETFTDVNGNGVWDTDMGRAEPGGSGDHVVFRLTMAQAVRHPLLTPIMGARLLHQAQIVVRNEPF